MAIYTLSKDIKYFPNPNLADETGIIAIGGDLSVERLINAYTTGIFPWYNENEPILWWSPAKRAILYPKDIHISKSMKKFLKKEIYRITYDTCFEKVISLCGATRKETWITKEIKEAYIKLFNLGIAHSVEVWDEENNLIGGLYGESLGKIFFGESMFSIKKNASKVAFINLAKNLEELNFDIIDCQVQNDYLESMGVIEINRLEYLNILENSLQKPSLIGKWNFK
ncbi:leucyl/phenylalanyl-tRNA--protein transferase [Hypnocyclicus thermotrophus]|uniref:Leucyl/phenylalanyl-tRNA--protein transferase n=1 Tax=Hypnocyclicus thermotrophus TaxID=1627895 RepID=A0AA46DX32_9FUSO|nr:leucyl/phenylalanyl-tRNA--protein transferase [Hypnocyclicus thermotrophus]TDT67433.1 leucyl/phenylalanyl-tRNA--protein transferase [Hypnocyclicus thermotrophus]